MSAPGNSNKDAASDAGRLTSTSRILSWLTSGSSSTSAGVPETTAVSTPRIAAVDAAIGIDTRDDTSVASDAVFTTSSPQDAFSAPGSRAVGAARHIAPAATNDGGEEEDDDEHGVDPGFDDISALHPLFGQGTPNDFSDMFLGAPIYGLSTLAAVSGHTLRICADGRIEGIDDVTKVKIYDVANDMFDSGRDLLNLAYGLVYRDHIPWSFTTGVNMAVRQMRINSDATLLRECGEGTPYKLIWDIASGNRTKQVVSTMPLESYIRTDVAKLDVEKMLVDFRSVGEASAFYLGGTIHDCFIPDIKELSARLGKTLIFQPPFVFLSNKLLNEFPYLKNCDEYRGSIADELTDNPLIGVISDATLGLAPGPENLIAVHQLVSVLEDALAALDMEDAAVKLLRLSKTCGNPVNTAVSMPVVGRNAGAPGPATANPQADKEVALGRTLVTRDDLAALVHAVHAGPANLSHSLKECGYYDRDTQKAEVFGTYMAGSSKFQGADRAKIKVLYLYESDIVRQCLRLAAILSVGSDADASRAIIQPGKAAVIHMVRSFPQSACQKAYNAKATIDYEWVFA